jgi:hypothetical protein
MCVLGVSILPLSTILLLNFGTVVLHHAVVGNVNSHIFRVHLYAAINSVSRSRAMSIHILLGCIFKPRSNASHSCVMSIHKFIFGCTSL